MTLKTDIIDFVRDELHIPLIGIVPANDFPLEDVERITPVVELFSRSTPLAAGAEGVLHPRDFLDGAKSVIVAGSPGYFGKMPSIDACREQLQGRAEPSHVNIGYLLDSQEKGNRLTEFLAERGFSCCSVVGIQFPLKIAASKCGIGFYGKNALIQHPEYGSWISLSAYVTDADLESDAPLEGDCGSCERCIEACPTGALYEPYRCDPSRCLDFNLGHNKNIIPFFIRDKSGNLMGEGCTACRDACPVNQKLKKLENFSVPDELVHPSLLDVFDMTDEQWEQGFAMTLMGFFLLDKKYLQRNAAIGLGNFKDRRAVNVLLRVVDQGDDEVRGYAAWALGKIGGSSSVQKLKESLERELNETVKSEIKAALENVEQE